MGTNPAFDSCATPSPVERLKQLPGQLSLEETPEWRDATSPFLAYLDRLEQKPAA